VEDEDGEDGLLDYGEDGLGYAYVCGDVGGYGVSQLGTEAETCVGRRVQGAVRGPSRRGESGKVGDDSTL